MEILIEKIENPLNQSKNHGKFMENPQFDGFSQVFPALLITCRVTVAIVAFCSTCDEIAAAEPRRRGQEKNIFKIQHDENVHQSNIYVHYIFTCSFLFSYVLRCCSSLFIHKIVDFSN